MRALRVDKLTYAALEATLEEYAAGRSRSTIPVAMMLALTADEIGRRADALASALSSRGLPAEIADGHSTLGGGSAPGSALPTRLVSIAHPTLSATAFEAQLRRGAPPIVARIEHDRVVLDLRTVDPADDELLVARLYAAAER